MRVAGGGLPVFPSDRAVERLVRRINHCQKLGLPRDVGPGRPYYSQICAKCFPHLGHDGFQTGGKPLTLRHLIFGISKQIGQRMDDPSTMATRSIRVILPFLVCVAQSLCLSRVPRFKSLRKDAHEHRQ
jgi:hypothetical protein